MSALDYSKPIVGEFPYPAQTSFQAVIVGRIASLNHQGVN
jgi:hypothetical protein